MAASAMSYTQYFCVEQRSPKWEEIRCALGGTSGKYHGYCSFTRPRDAYEDTLDGISHVTSSACDHGNKFEARSEVVFKEWLSANSQYRDQAYTLPGYDVPDPRVHPIFTEERDALRFGVSLDVRGSLIDCEIKNPTTLASYKRWYVPMFSPTYFFQVQWAMAVRNRQRMYFIATSYDAKTEVLQEYAIWLVTFAKDFFVRAVLPTSRKIADSILAQDRGYYIEADAPWINERGRFARSKEYAKLFQDHCTRVY